MNAAVLVETLLREGVTVLVEGSDLVVKGPATALTPEVLSTLRRDKAEIMSFLESDDAPLYALHLDPCLAPDGGRCSCRPILVSRKEAAEWGWST